MPQQVKKWSEYAPPGRRVSGDWDVMAYEKNESGKMVVHLIIWDGARIVLVKNARKKGDGFQKPAAWGLPTETVRSGEPTTIETPYAAVERVVREELNLFDHSISVNSKPILVTKTSNEVLHFYFGGTMEPYTEIPKDIRDVNQGEVSAATLVDPDTIQIPDASPDAPEIERFPFFENVDGKQIIYPGHLGGAAYARFHG